MTIQYDVAQFTWDATDGHGANPNEAAFSGTTIDWAHNRVFLWNGQYIRGYDISTFETFNPYVSNSLPAGVLTTVCGIRTTFDGYVLTATTGYNGVSKLDPTTLNQIARFGATSTTYPNGIGGLRNGWDAALGCCEVNGVGYALGREIVGAHGGLIRTDTMTAAGFYQNLSGGWFGNGMVCGGASCASSGSFYCIDEYQLQNGNSQVYLFKVTVLAGAETYNVSSWPTQNPYVSYSIIQTITPTMVDPAFTTIASNSIGYDAKNNIVLLQMSEFAGSDTRFVGVDGDTRTVLWSIKPFPSGWTWAPDLAQWRG